MKYLSRKLMVLVAATALLMTGHITPDIWQWVALGYLGVQGYQDSKPEVKPNKP